MHCEANLGNVETQNFASPIIGKAPNAAPFETQNFASLLSSGGQPVVIYSIISSTSRVLTVPCHSLGLRIIQSKARLRSSAKKRTWSTMNSVGGGPTR